MWFCGAAGLVLLLVLLIASGALLGGQLVGRQQKWASVIVRITLPLVLVCAVVVLVIMESFPGHGWRSRNRTNVLQAIDANTGKAIPIIVYNPPLPEDPWLTWGLSLIDPTKVKIEWDDPVPLYITSTGYGLKTVTLSASTPQVLQISLSPSNQPVATQPNWDRFP
jgi:hypothetical protein